MSILPTHNIENLFTSQEIDEVNQLIIAIGKYNIDDGESYPDSGNNGKYAGKSIANNIHWNYHNHPEIEKILSPKLEHLLQKKLIVNDAHILEAKIPYLIHTDFIHNNQGFNPEYTILIPLDTYDSITVCFNEWAENYNDFEIFKQNYSGETKLKIDPKFCANRLSHLHPKDLMYLTLHDTFAWNKGSVFAMDRRYFHCSDNFSKRGLVQKRSIVLWTLS
jgi:hypothetical protein